MKTPFEEHELLTDLLADAAPADFRRGTLENGLTLLRQKRARRRAVRAACLVIPLIVAAIVFVLQQRPGGTTRTSNGAPVGVPATTPEVISGTSIRVLNDEELLDFFKGRPVALVGRAGRQQLVLFDEVKN